MDAHWQQFWGTPAGPILLGVLLLWVGPWWARRAGIVLPPLGPWERRLNARMLDIVLLTGVMAWYLSAGRESGWSGFVAAVVLCLAAQTDGPTGLICGRLLTLGAIGVGVLAVSEGHLERVVAGLVAAGLYAGLGRLMARRTAEGQAALGDGDPWLLGIAVAGLGAHGIAAFWLGNGFALASVLSRREQRAHFGPWLAVGVLAEVGLSYVAPGVAAALRLGL